MAFPITLTGAVDGVTEIIAAHLNSLEAKMGVDGSAVVSSLDYLLKNVASVDPGHKHDHGGLQGLGDDDHTIYIKADGTRAFTGVVSGVTPTSAAHLATKGYVDAAVVGLEWQDSVKDKELTAPPGSPTTGHRYIVASVATGDWATHEKDIAQYNGATWDFVTPNEGMAVWVDDEDCIYVYSGAAWAKMGTFLDHANLINLTTGDPHTQYILHSLATAANDFLVASGSGAYVKKTLAETKVILELPASPYVIGDLFYASSTTAQAKLAAVAVNNALISGGIGAPPSWGKVSLAAMADMATGALLGRNTALAGIPEVITDIPTAITIGGAYVYRAGGTDVAVADGGTNLSSYTAGDILYASAATTLTKLAKAAAGNVLLSGDSPSWGKVGLTTHVDGILGSANGGTGNGFTKFTGPITAEKTFTLPDASATILTTNAAVTAAQGGTGQSSYAVGDLLYASASSALSKLAGVAVGNVLISGGVTTAPSWGKVALTTHVSGILPPVNGGDGGTTASASGPVTVTTALNRQTYVATGAVEYDLPTGDLSAFVAVGAVPLKYTFVKTGADTLTIDPGAGNFIANGIAAAKLYDDVSGETYATVTLQLTSSTGSVNRWVIVGAHGSWSL